MEKCYAAIDLKSFYASVECIQRGLDPMTAHLVVADPSRTSKTICLAVTPALKALGIPGRPRLFEVEQRVALLKAMGKDVDYIVAPPQMATYMAVSAKIYEVYLRHVAPEDIHVYSVDEVFVDLTPYLRISGMTPKEFVARMVRDVYVTTGITATAGIGTNRYLCKVARDIVAKHAEADETGMRIAQLDEMEYRRQLWEHQPLTDFWRIGPGYTKRLQKVGLRTMGDIARCSLENEDLLYKLFGVNAQLLIDHAWGWEPCTLQHIKAYKPSTHSICSGQVLTQPYTYEKACLVIREMTDALALDLVEKGLVTDQLVLTVGYDIDNVSWGYTGPVVTDRYGRQIPKHAHGTCNLHRPCASSALLLKGVSALCEKIMDKSLLVRRIQLTANHVMPEGHAQNIPRQLDLFTDPAELDREDAALERERRRQKAVLTIKRRYGKNAILRGMNFKDGATARERNAQVGGHKA